MSAVDKHDFEPFDRHLLLLMLAPPVVWLTQLSVIYTFVPQACVWSSKIVLHLLTGAALAITVAATWLSWRALVRIGPHGSISHPHESRRRFMAVTGFVFGILFSMLAIAIHIPNFILRTCD